MAELYSPEGWSDEDFKKVREESNGSFVQSFDRLKGLELEEIARSGHEKSGSILINRASILHENSEHLMH